MKKTIPNYIEVQESMAERAKKILKDIQKTEQKENVRFEPEYVNLKLAEAFGCKASSIGGNIPFILCFGFIIVLVVIDWLL